MEWQNNYFERHRIGSKFAAVRWFIIQRDHSTHKTRINYWINLGLIGATKMWWGATRIAPSLSTCINLKPLQYKQSLLKCLYTYFRMTLAMCIHNQLIWIAPPPSLRSSTPIHSISGTTTLHTHTHVRTRGPCTGAQNIEITVYSATLHRTNVRQVYACPSRFLNFIYLFTLRLWI